jgi:hypothetical protein
MFVRLRHGIHSIKLAARYNHHRHGLRQSGMAWGCHAYGSFMSAATASPCRGVTAGFKMNSDGGLDFDPHHSRELRGTCGSPPTFAPSTPLRSAQDARTGEGAARSLPCRCVLSEAASTGEAARKRVGGGSRSARAEFKISCPSQSPIRNTN